MPRVWCNSTKQIGVVSFSLDCTLGGCARIWKRKLQPKLLTLCFWQGLVHGVEGLWCLLSCVRTLIDQKTLEMLQLCQCWESFKWIFFYMWLKYCGWFQTVAYKDIEATVVEIRVCHSPHGVFQVERWNARFEPWKTPMVWFIIPNQLQEGPAPWL